MAEATIFEATLWLMLGIISHGGYTLGNCEQAKLYWLIFVVWMQSPARNLEVPSNHWSRLYLYAWSCGSQQRFRDLQHWFRTNHNCWCSVPDNQGYNRGVGNLVLSADPLKILTSCSRFACIRLDIPPLSSMVLFSSISEYVVLMKILLVLFLNWGREKTHHGCLPLLHFMNNSWFCLNFKIVWQEGLKVSPTSQPPAYWSLIRRL